MRRAAGLFLLTTVCLSSQVFPVLAPRGRVPTTASRSPPSLLLLPVTIATKESFYEQLDNYKPAEITRQRNFYAGWHNRFQKIDRTKLTPEEAADLAILQDQIRLSLLDFDILQNFRHNPNVLRRIDRQRGLRSRTCRHTRRKTSATGISSRAWKTAALSRPGPPQLVSAPAIWVKVAPAGERRQHRPHRQDHQAPRSPHDISRLRQGRRPRPGLFARRSTPSSPKACPTTPGS